MVWGKAIKESDSGGSEFLQLFCLQLLQGLC